MPTPHQSTISLIGISGKQYAGKDVLADLCVSLLPGFTKVPIALAIKQAYSQKTGLSLQEIESHKAQHRPALIELGDWGRAQNPDYWLTQVLNQSGLKIISDVRLQREYELLKAHGALLIRIEAGRELRSHRGSLVSETDPTECELDTVTDWDAVFVNEGSIADLKEKLSILLQQNSLLSVP